MTEDYAFPQAFPQPIDGRGMTLRDYFAAKAMQELLCVVGSDKAHVARESYEMADAMLAAREKSASGQAVSST